MPLGSLSKTRLLLFSVIYGLWVVNIAAFNGEAASELANQFLTLAERQRTSGPIMLAHRMTGITMMSVGDLVGGRAHLDRALSLYDPREHRDLETRFGTDPRVAILEWRSRTLLDALAIPRQLAMMSKFHSGARERLVTQQH